MHHHYVLFLQYSESECENRTVNGLLLLERIYRFKHLKCIWHQRLLNLFTVTFAFTCRLLWHFSPWFLSTVLAYDSCLTSDVFLVHNWCVCVCVNLYDLPLAMNFANAGFLSETDTDSATILPCNNPSLDFATLHLNSHVIRNYTAL